MGRQIRADDFPAAFLVHIPPADGQPGLALDWPAICQSAVDAGIRRVERWLTEPNKSNLWITLHVGRAEYEPTVEMLAYETAFLWRLQQRLMASESNALEASRNAGSSL
ncbi:LasR-specific antiactivator QslA [Pseudomonas sp. LABIM340]|uniref:LasR-specific antiactivator QslA n=1 Tax=Pseudomonas sp. LABIM340 TaxID=3156585 RepID=UPI0032B013E0